MKCDKAGRYKPAQTRYKIPMTSKYKIAVAGAGIGMDSPLSPMQPIPLSYGALWGIVDTPTKPQSINYG
ncbi:MAG: hypothetical protein QNK92_02785 [Amylibacter sp.]